MIDDLFNLIINKDKSIPNEFYLYLEKLDLMYTPEIVEKINSDNTKIIKEIIYTLYEIYNSSFNYLFSLFKRETLINIYNLCKSTGDVKNFIAYYKRSIINKYTEDIM